MIHKKEKVVSINISLLCFLNDQLLNNHINKMNSSSIYMLELGALVLKIRIITSDAISLTTANHRNQIKG